jgi:hypothetical protein
MTNRPDTEIWRDIHDYEGLYQVSNLGRVRSLDREVPDARCGSRRFKGRAMKLTKGPSYLCLSLCKRGVRRTHTVHQLVANAFLGPRPVGMEICHGPEGQFVNTVDNLSYGTSKQNSLDMRRDGTNTGVEVVRSDGKRYANMRIAAEDVGCHNSQICMVCRGTVKTAGGYGWSYA